MKDKKQEPTNFEIEDLREKDPFVKKAAKVSAFLYLGLAVLVVVIATIGIFSISYSGDTDIDLSVPELNIGDVSIPDIKVPSRPVQHEQSGVPADIIKPDESSSNTENVPSKPTYYRPVEGNVLKGYSMDALVFSKTMRDYRVHPGIDILAPEGTAVVAYTDGKVISVRDDYFYGTTVAIEHAEGVVSYYMNLAPELSPDIVEGAEVRGGQAIGTIGSSAKIENADDPHLHFELRVNGALVDPTDELP